MADDTKPETPDGMSHGHAGDPAQARGSVDPTDSIGARVADFRTRKGMRVSALARAVNVSPSLISQIERGQSRPSVSTLFALAEALEVKVDAFFRDGEDERPQPRPEAPAAASAERPAAPDREQRYVVRRDDRAVIDIDGGVHWERLTPTAMNELEFLELVYEPHGESHSSLYRHPGVEMVLVLSGRLEIFVGFERYELAVGDSICFPSTLPHRYVNPTGETTRAVSVILPDGATFPPQSDLPPEPRRP
jgi:transcriptional regulator with XRE-family HTH domain